MRTLRPISCGLPCRAARGGCRCFTALPASSAANTTRRTRRCGSGTACSSSTADATPWLAGADVLITDHGSIGFEYLLLDRPVVRIAMPELISGADLAVEYVELLANASASIEHADEVVPAVVNGLRSPERLAPA